MSLRSRLAIALLLAALLPMIVVVGVPILRAGARARAEALGRLELVKRQAAFFLDRFSRETVARAGQAAAELARDRSLLDPVLSGPEDSARAAAVGLAQRHGLDWIEVVATDGTVLAATSSQRRIGDRHDLAGIPEGKGVVSTWPEAGAGPAGVLARQAVPTAREVVWLAGGRILDQKTIAEIAELTGQPVVLESRDGRVRVDVGLATAAKAIDHTSAGAVFGGGAPENSAHAADSAAEAAPSGQGVIGGLVPLDGDGWALRVYAPAADTRRERRDLLAAFAGLAPVALISAIVVGALIAARISRPIRFLADRADEISKSRAGFRLLQPERDEVRRLTDSFDRMLHALEGSERRRAAAERIAAWEQVARRIAHEVKNPLSPIQLAVENLRRTRERAPADFDRALEVETATILEEVASLRRLVDEFSQFARLPRPALATCDPRALVNQALALYSARISNLGVAVEIVADGAAERITADPDQVGRVLKNIIANALDSLESVTGRRLTIRLSRDGLEAQPFAVIEVNDTGMGLDSEAALRIFEPYFTTRAERGGTGLGMAIAHRIVSEHGGTLEAAGAPGQGATVTIRLPEGGPDRAGDPGASLRPLRLDA